MFASRKSRAEHTAVQAWEYLSEAMSTAGESAKGAGRATAGVAERAGRRTRGLAGRTGDRVTSVTDEARVRAIAAADALAGRSPGRPWGLITGAILAGAAIGWVAATTARAALQRQAEDEESELAETAIVVTPSYDEP
ncbi:MULTISPECIES: hypothetical protein [Actinoplanes]|uniref:hypothetical protein n=1 Tax=Actinoplanes TaxID=1865 RepID=UPI0005F29DB9|nr:MULTISPECIES: hypothetical protein [Actinoplanes]GLY01644.1 hypothetical protein Acsp01_20230 [Actinoplanes sp. NBRC 101535]